MNPGPAEPEADMLPSEPGRRAQLVILHHEKGRTYREIASLLEIKKISIGNVICRYKNEERIKKLTHTDHPRIFMRREWRAIVQKIKKDRRIAE